MNVNPGFFKAQSCLSLSWTQAQGNFFGPNPSSFHPYSGTQSIFIILVFGTHRGGHAIRGHDIRGHDGDDDDEEEELEEGGPGNFIIYDFVGLPTGP